MTSQPHPPAPVAPQPVAPRPVAPPELVPERHGAVAFLSNVSRQGDWIAPRLFRGVAFMGSVELDLTAARLGAGVSTIELMIVMGSATIVVPPDVRLECAADAMMGSVEVKGDARTTAAPDAPVVRIEGTVLMGNVTVRVVDPNAPGWIDRLRARLTGG